MGFIALSAILFSLYKMTLALGSFVESHNGAITAIASIAVAVFTWTLWQSSEKMWIVTKIAADAAELSAKAAIGVELPILGIDAPDLNRIDAPVPKDGPYGSANLEGLPDRYSVISWMHLRNAGRTPAFATDFAIGWCIAQVQPQKPSFDLVVPLDAGNIIEPKGELDVDLHYTIELTESQRDALRTKNQFLWVSAQFKYRDFLNQTRVVTASWRWSNPSGGIYFFERGGISLNAAQYGQPI
ncbi:hypothetical protein [Methylocystis rosea]|uniref:hypothetical protein n=1 Tax=Methylocystis rosea TaxID=173366 RepID=UPI0012EBFD0A|nr:hypothetical protein [Methylocystis rosea]